LEDLQRPEAESEEPEQPGGREADDADPEVEAAAAVEVADDDRDRTQAESARNPDAAPAGWVRGEVAQRLDLGSAWETSRPLRRYLRTGWFGQDGCHTPLSAQSMPTSAAHCVVEADGGVV
jgi:hypothetical protein